MSVRLAHVREPDQRHVGQQLQLEPQPPLLAHLALLGERRRPAPVGQEAGVAPAAPAALGRQPAVALRARGRPAPRRPGRARRCPRAPARSRSSPAAPWRCLPWPWVPSLGPAVRVVLERRAATPRCGRRPATRRRRSPPSPPSGPPLGTCASRRNATAPAPPSPASHVQAALVDEAGHRRSGYEPGRALLDQSIGAAPQTHRRPASWRSRGRPSEALAPLGLTRSNGRDPR